MVVALLNPSEGLEEPLEGRGWEEREGLGALLELEEGLEVQGEELGLPAGAGMSGAVGCRYIGVEGLGFRYIVSEGLDCRYIGTGGLGTHYTGAEKLHCRKSVRTAVGGPEEV